MHHHDALVSCRRLGLLFLLEVGVAVGSVELLRHVRASNAAEVVEKFRRRALADRLLPVQWCPQRARRPHFWYVEVEKKEYYGRFSGQKRNSALQRFRFYPPCPKAIAALRAPLTHTHLQSTIGTSRTRC